MNYKPQVGDIILEDSNKFGARIVKFFMTAPTFYQHAWRAIFKTQEIVEYYHVAMIYKVEGSIIKEIEQQNVVKINDFNPTKPQIIFRKKNLSTIKQNVLKIVSELDLDEGYDILNVFGKLLTWLTGFPWFARYIERPEEDICVNRVAYWYKIVCHENFGVLEHSELTTHQLHKYLLNNNEYKVVYKHN